VTISSLTVELIDAEPAAVLEPFTWAMLLIGFAAIGVICRRPTIIDRPP
jgi:hypothetical protein